MLRCFMACFSLDTDVLSTLEIRSHTACCSLLSITAHTSLSLSLSLSALRTVLTPVQFLVSQSNSRSPAAVSFLSYVKGSRFRAQGTTYRYWGRLAWKEGEEGKWWVSGWVEVSACDYKRLDNNGVRGKRLFPVWVYGCVFAQNCLSYADLLIGWCMIPV